MKINKMLWLLPMMMILLMVSAYAALDATWTCPLSGTTAGTVVKDYAVYSDEAPYKLCTKSGNNLTIEFNITGIEIAEGTPENFNATFYLYKDSKQKFMLPLPIGNRSVENIGALVRWTDFGELHGSSLSGLPKWFNNLTEGSYKYYFEVWNLTDTSTGNQLLSNEKGLNSGSPVRFTIDNDEGVNWWAVAADETLPGSEQAQSVLGIKAKPTQTNLLALAAIVFGVWYFLLRDKKKR